MRNRNKKGNLATFGSLAIGLVTLMVVLVVGFLIMSQGRTQVESINSLNGSEAACVGDTACNSTIILTNAAADIPGWAPLIVITVIGAALLGLVKLFRS